MVQDDFTERALGSFPLAKNLAVAIIQTLGIASTEFTFSSNTAQLKHNGGVRIIIFPVAGPLMAIAAPQGLQ